MNIEINENINHYYSFNEIRNIFHDFSKLDFFSIQEIGISEAGNPIELISYKKTKSNNSILLFGGEDASEAIFSQTIFWILSELSKTDSQIHNLDLDWHFISCINPDGYLKNEGWLKHPGDLKYFLENSWEDIHSRLLFWKTEERIEHEALKKAIMISRPNLIYNLHDESHFPADGCKFAFSETINLELLNSHLDRIKEFMDVSYDELVIISSYGLDPKFSISPAFELNKDTFAFMNESCGYKLITDSSPKIFINTSDILYDSLKAYQKLQVDNFNSELESSLFHTNLLIKSIEKNEEMLSITGYGLEYLLKLNINDAKKIKEVFLNHIKSNFQNTYMPIPVWKQVFAQIDFLFTMLKIRCV
jgi:hypothetical protein